MLGSNSAGPKPCNSNVDMVGTVKMAQVEAAAVLCCIHLTAWQLTRRPLALQLDRSAGSKHADLKLQGRERW